MIYTVMRRPLKLTNDRTLEPGERFDSETALPMMEARRRIRLMKTLVERRFLEPVYATGSTDFEPGPPDEPVAKPAPVHIGFGRYRLPDGRTVKGKDKAYAMLEVG